MREGGTDIAKWPTLTWLPFIADPARHVVVRSSIIQAFASAYPRELNFKPQINALSYRCIREFVEDFRRVLQASEINRSGREFDLMDVQSFMWAVAKYKKIDVDKTAYLTYAAEACLRARWIKAPVLWAWPWCSLRVPIELNASMLLTRTAFGQKQTLRRSTQVHYFAPNRRTAPSNTQGAASWRHSTA